MSQHDSVAIRKPRTDDRALQELVMGMWVYPAVLVAHQLGLFSILDETLARPRKSRERLASSNDRRRRSSWRRHRLAFCAPRMAAMRSRRWRRITCLPGARPISGCSWI